jgi:hypothetical protein
MKNGIDTALFGVFPSESSPGFGVEVKRKMTAPSPSIAETADLMPRQRRLPHRRWPVHVFFHLADKTTVGPLPLIQPPI